MFLIQGWNSSSPEAVRQHATSQRLFREYPDYLLNADLITAAIAPDFRELLRRGKMLLFQKLLRHELNPGLVLTKYRGS